MSLSYLFWTSPSTVYEKYAHAVWISLAKGWLSKVYCHNQSVNLNAIDFGKKRTHAKFSNFSKVCCHNQSVNLNAIDFGKKRTHAKF